MVGSDLDLVRMVHRAVGTWVVLGRRSTERRLRTKGSREVVLVAQGRR